MSNRYCLPTAVRLVWDIALNDLRTKTIVESMNRIVKKIKTANDNITFDDLVRRVLLKLLIPDDHAMKTVIVKLCAKAYEFGDQIIQR